MSEVMMMIFERVRQRKETNATLSTTSPAVFQETDGEPKVTWLQQHMLERDIRDARHGVVDSRVYVWTRTIKRRLDICSIMTNLEALLAKGPSGDAEAGLEQLRYTILSDGIPSNSDGMVRWSLL